MRRLGLALLALLMPALASAATYTVGPSGRTYTTIGACLTAAQPGDICDVYTGDYTSAGVISSVRAGTSNTARITVSVHTGETATVRGFYISHNYITISGFTIHTGTATNMGVRSYSTVGVIIENNTITAERATCVQFGSNSGNLPHSYIIRNNTITRCGWYGIVEGTGSGWGISAYGNDSLIEGNDISHVTNDAINWSGTHSVVRNNIAHTIDNDETGVHATAHIDMVHNGSIAIIESLIEGNVYRDVLDSTGNAHLTWFEGQTGYEQRNLIFRYNYANNIQDTATAGINLAANAMSRFYQYNNTITHGGASLNEGHCIILGANVPYSRAKNFLCYNINPSSYWPIYDGGAPSTQEHNGNLPFITGYSGAWSGPITTEATYTTLRNLNPLLANYPTDGTLQAGSPARNAGVALTTVAVADTGSGTTLVLTDAGYFQPGWGPSYAPVSADQIRIGASTVATIASIDYATNIVTLTAPVSRSDNDPVYLYKKSDAALVLPGALPDVGAYPYRGGVTAPAAPTNVRIR